MYFAKSPRDLVPLTDPWGREYLRTDNICKQFLRPTDPDAARYLRKKD